MCAGVASTLKFGTRSQGPHSRGATKKKERDGKRRAETERKCEEREGERHEEAEKGSGVKGRGTSDNWMRKQKPHCSTKCQSTRTNTSNDDGDAQSLISIATARWRQCTT